MKVVYIFSGMDPDDRPEADLECPKCGYKDLYVFSWSDKSDAAHEYCKGWPCPKCGHIDN